MLFSKLQLYINYEICNTEVFVYHKIPKIEILRSIVIVRMTLQIEQ